MLLDSTTNKEVRMAIKLNPYLNFSGNTREAMEFYKSVFGGELTLSTFGETPGMEVPEGYEDKIMHAQLLSDDLTMMASEAMAGSAPSQGSNISLSLSGDDEAKLTKIFADLAAGGQITQPLEKQVWGDKFGMALDKFGITWMVNINQS
jgi:PhnB protein